MRNLVFIKFGILLLASHVLVACGMSAAKFNQLSIGMSKSEVIETLGNPYTTRASSRVTYLAYQIRGSQWKYNGEYDLFFVRIVNGKVEAYGKWGDFDSTKDPTLNQNITIKPE